MITCHGTVRFAHYSRRALPFFLLFIVGIKMRTWSLGRPVLPSQGSRRYYEVVSDATPDVQEFYRYFEIPDLGHCVCGVGGQLYAGV